MRFNPLLSITLATLPLSSSMPSSPPETPITAGFGLAVRAPEPMPQQENTGSFFLGTPDHTSGNKLPPPDPISWYNSLTPNQTSKSCHGSIICPFTGQACQYAASRFDDSLLYRNFTSYTYKLGNPILLHSCAAVFSCDSNEAYVKGMTGAQIKGAYVIPTSSSPPCMIADKRLHDSQLLEYISRLWEPLQALRILKHEKCWMPRVGRLLPGLP